MGEPLRAGHDSVWSRAPGWVDRVVGDDVLVKGRNGEDRTLGGLAAAVWIVLDEPGTPSQTAERIREAWPGPEVDDDTVEDDTVEEAMALLAEHGLVQHDVEVIDQGHGHLRR